MFRELKYPVSGIKFFAELPKEAGVIRSLDRFNGMWVVACEMGVYTVSNEGVVEPVSDGFVPMDYVEGNRDVVG